MTLTESGSEAPADSLNRYATIGLWALPVWAALLLVGTWERQPDPKTNFADWAEFTTTTWFLISHLIASILGAAIGIIGLVALFVVVSRSNMVRMATVALVASVVGNVLITSIFGAAAFAQPAMGNAYLTGSTEAAMVFESDVYGPALFATALPGLLLLTVGLVLFGIASARSGQFPRYAGYGFAVSGILFTLIGFAIGEIQTIGAALMIATTVWMSWSYRQQPHSARLMETVEPELIQA